MQTLNFQMEVSSFSLRSLPFLFSYEEAFGGSLRRLVQEDTKYRAVDRSSSLPLPFEHGKPQNKENKNNWIRVVIKRLENGHVE